MHSIPFPSRWKAWILKAFGAKIGSRVVIRSRVNITMPWRLEIGDDVWVGDEVMILSLDRVTIASNCCLSQRSFLCTGSHDFSSETFSLITKPIVIEESCWVGAQSFIGPGVTMKMGSRTLAGAVVIRNVDQGTAVAGVPAKPIHVRSESDITPNSSR
jgi:putative colanic acid biosynthesis acetyltransferase WcaF